MLSKTLVTLATSGLAYCSDSPISKRTAKRRRRKATRRLSHALIAEALEAA